VVHRHSRSAESLDQFSIDPLRAVRGRDQEWVREYERRSQEPALTPIGEASRGYLIMCMAPSGAVYGGYDNVLLNLGVTGDDTLEGLCAGRADVITSDLRTTARRTRAWQSASSPRSMIGSHHVDQR
jgi:SUKH-3 immunity protein